MNVETESHTHSNAVSWYAFLFDVESNEQGINFKNYVCSRYKQFVRHQNLALCRQKPGNTQNEIKTRWNDER